MDDIEEQFRKKDIDPKLVTEYLLHKVRTLEGRLEIVEQHLKRLVEEHGH